jgi:hypothetical protein
MPPGDVRPLFWTVKHLFFVIRAQSRRSEPLG